MKTSSMPAIVEKAMAASKEKVDDDDLLARLSTRESIKIRGVFDSATTLLVEGVLVWDAKGLHMRASNNICACDMKLPKESKTGCVEDYVFNAAEPLVCAVSFESFQTCLACIGPADVCIIRVTRKGYYALKPYIILTVAHPTSSYIYDFRIHLLCVEKVERSLPPITFERVVSLGSNLFLKILRTCVKRGDAVQIFTSKENDMDYLCFRVDGDDSQGFFRVRFDNIGDQHIESCEKRDLYSLRYLMLISKAATLSSVIRIYLKKNSILGIGLNVGCIGTIFFCLSPNLKNAEPYVNQYPTIKILEDEGFKKEIQKRKKRKRTKKN